MKKDQSKAWQQKDNIPQLLYRTLKNISKKRNKISIVAVIFIFFCRKTAGEKFFSSSCPFHYRILCVWTCSESSA